MQKQEDIAIIGLAARMSRSDTAEAFWNHLINGEHLVHDVEGQRMDDIRARFGDAVKPIPAAYLDRIDLFDYKFFGLTKGEAIKMDPEQRLFLEIATQSLYGAGYSLADLSGSNTGVFVSHANSQHRRLFDEGSFLDLTAHNPAVVSARVNYLLNLQGPSIMVNTNCSSSLVALHYACKALRDGECQMAVVGGSKISIETESTISKNPTYSPNYVCRVFSDGSDGSSHGEGVISMVLKKASDAYRDGDPVLAIIKGSASNHNGSRSNGITAPSSTGQGDNIRRAWAAAGVDPMTIGYVEAHGTGTPLGDPIEIDALINAYDGMTDEKQFLKISSVKSNIGHLDPLAGIAGLLKAVLSLQARKLAPVINFTGPNPHIDFESSPVDVVLEACDWVPMPGTDKLRGAVNSTGLSGSNVHIVIEEPDRQTVKADRPSVNYLKLSAQSPDGMHRMITHVIQEIEKSGEYGIDDVLYTLNTARDDHAIRRMITFSDRDELMRKLAELNKDEFRPKNENRHGADLICLAPGDAVISSELVNKLSRSSSVFDAAYRQAIGASGAETSEGNPALERFAAQYALGRLAESFTKKASLILGFGSGDLVARALKDENVLAEMVQKAMTAEEYAPLKSDKFGAFLKSLDTSKFAAVINLGEGGSMIGLAKQALSGLRVSTLSDSWLSTFIQPLYESRVPCSFRSLHNAKDYVRIHLLHPVFDLERCWPEDVRQVGSGQQEEEEEGEQERLNMAQISEVLADIWKDTLQLDTLAKDDDFFNIGGTSLSGLQILSIVEKKTGISGSYNDIFEYRTISAFSKRLMEIQEKMFSGKQEELPPVEVDFDGRKQKYDKLVSRTEAEGLETYKPERVFITGGTGFFGSYLLASMLQTTDAHLFCLIRGENDEVAADRLRKRIDSYFGEGFYQKYSDRLTVFKGDITEPYLGIGGKTFRELIGTIDTVHHPAADVRHFGFFEQSDKVNYEGTVNVFDFARFIGASYFNYYSTLDFAGHNVPGVKGMDVYETDLDIGQDFNREIYATTKYKAEKFVSDNATDDMGVKIIRLGNLTGHYQTGHFQENISENFIYMLIKTFCDLPVLGRGMERIGIEMSPINWSADAAVKLSTIKHTGLLKLHNIHYQAMNTGLIAEAFGKLGVNVEQKDYNEFVDELNEKQNTEGGDVLTGSRVMEFGFMNGAKRTNYNYRCDMTSELRNKLGEEWKELDVDYLIRIIRYGAEKGFFPIDEEKMATA